MDYFKISFKNQRREQIFFFNFFLPKIWKKKNRGAFNLGAKQSHLSVQTPSKMKMPA